MIPKRLSHPSGAVWLTAVQAVERTITVLIFGPGLFLRAEDCVANLKTDALACTPVVGLLKRDLYLKLGMTAASHGVTFCRSISDSEQPKERVTHDAYRQFCLSFRIN